MKKLGAGALASAVLISIGALASCGAAAPAPTVTVTHTATVTVTATPEPTAEATSTALGVGQSATPRSGLTVTLHEVRADSALEAPAPAGADRWSSIDVEVCNNTGADGKFTPQNWRVLAGSYRFEPSSIGYRQFPEPDVTFSQDALVNGGCIRGWITFPTLAQALTGVTYTLSSGETAAWAL